MAIDVLICDDSAVMRNMVKRALNMTGLAIGNVDFANHGDDAIEKVSGRSYDLLLLDVNMPVRDGVSALTEIRRAEEGHGISVVAVTSEGSDEKRQALRDLRASIVSKPFTAEQLVDGILDAIRNPYGMAETPQRAVLTSF
ncbi:MAG: response regulator [Polyangiales bacterium]